MNPLQDEVERTLWVLDYLPTDDEVYTRERNTVYYPTLENTTVNLWDFAYKLAPSDQRFADLIQQRSIIHTQFRWDMASPQQRLPNLLTPIENHIEQCMLLTSKLKELIYTWLVEK